MKTNNFRGDLTDISAKKEPLFGSSTSLHSRCCWASLELICGWTCAISVCSWGSIMLLFAPIIVWTSCYLTGHAPCVQIVFNSPCARTLTLSQCWGTTLSITAYTVLRFFGMAGSQKWPIYRLPGRNSDKTDHETLANWFLVPEKWPIYRMSDLS